MRALRGRKRVQKYFLHKLRRLILIISRNLAQCINWQAGWLASHAIAALNLSWNLSPTQVHVGTSERGVWMSPSCKMTRLVGLPDTFAWGSIYNFLRGRWKIDDIASTRGTAWSSALSTCLDTRASDLLLQVDELLLLFFVTTSLFVSLACVWRLHLPSHFKNHYNLSRFQVDSAHP